MYFKSFLGAVLDTLLYVLKDGLLRLTNVRKLQCAKKCGKYFMALAVLFSFLWGRLTRLLARQIFNCVQIVYSIIVSANKLSNHKTDTHLEHKTGLKDKPASR